MGLSVEGWYERERFVVHDLYVDADGLFVLQYLGIVGALVARKLLGDLEHQIDTVFETDPVMLFRAVEDDTDFTVAPCTHGFFYTHTKSDADRGYGFIAIADLIQSDDVVGIAEHARSVSWQTHPPLAAKDGPKRCADDRTSRPLRRRS